MKWKWPEAAQRWKGALRRYQYVLLVIAVGAVLLLLPTGGRDSPQPEEPAPLTAEDKAAAYDAACDYYLGTVFDVQGLTEIGLRAGEITFQVSCTKGGAKVDPDRTISLARENGAWTVVSEGY